MALVADRSGADIHVAAATPAATAKRRGDALRPGVVVGESEILPARRARSHLFAGSGQLALEAVESFDDVGEETRFPLLAVSDNIDPRFDLLPHHVRDRPTHLPRKLFAVVGLALFLESKKRQQGIGRARLPTWVVRIRCVLCFMAFPFSWLADAEPAHDSRRAFAVELSRMG